MGLEEYGFKPLNKKKEDEIVSICVRSIITRAYDVVEDIIDVKYLDKYPRSNYDHGAFFESEYYAKIEHRIFNQVARELVNLADEKKSNAYPSYNKGGEMHGETGIGMF